MPLARSFLMHLLALMVLLAPLSASAALPASQASSPMYKTQERLVVMDWTMLETLIALGHPPIGAADLNGYKTWVGSPPLPGEVVDIGLRNQPNLELLSQLAPDRFLVAPIFASLEPLLSKIAPVEIIPLYTGEGSLWQGLQAFTRSLAGYTPEPEAADRLIKQVEARLDTLARDLPDDLPSLLIVQFMDDRHVRVFGKHSLYSAVLDQMQLGTAWQGKTNSWGFSLVGIEALATAANLSAGPIRMVVVEPLPLGLRARIERPGLWESLPPVARGDVLYLPPAWSFGGLPSAQRFAELLHEAIHK